MKSIYGSYYCSHLYVPRFYWQYHWHASSQKKVWFESLKADPKTNIFLDVVEKLGLSELRSNLNKLNSVYRSPAHLGNFYLEHGVL